MNSELNSCVDIKTLEYYPIFDDQNEFDFFYEQILWNLRPVQHAIKVKLFIDKSVNIIDKEIPSWIEICISQNSRSKVKSDYYFIWRQDHYLKSAGYIKRRGLEVDEFSGVNVFEKYCEFLNNILDIDILTSKMRLASLSRKESEKQSGVNIIGSGGSVADLINSRHCNKLKDGINIYLGSAIIYPELIEAIPPSYVIATDGASQFGRSKSALRFKEISLFLIRNSNAIVVTLSHFQPMISSHWPHDVQDNFIYVPVKTCSPEQFSRSTSLSEVFEAYGTRNVLTCLALPLAACFKKKITFHGVTLFPGELNEAKHWDHYRESFYRAHVADILHVHLSALPKTQNYVNNHHHILRSIISNFQKSGHHFFSGGLEVKFERRAELSYTLTLCQKIERISQRFRIQTVKTTRVFLQSRYIRVLCSVVNIQLLSFIIGIILLLFSATYTNGFSLMQETLIVCLVVFGIVLMLAILKIWITRAERTLSIQSAHQFSNLEKRLAELESEGFEDEEE